MKILIADSCPIFRDGLSLHLNRILPDAKIRQAPDYAQFIKILTEERNYDLLFLDWEMPNLPHQNIFKDIKKLAPLAKIIVLANSKNFHNTKQVSAAGASGCLAKQTEISELYTAIKSVLAGNKYVSSLLNEHTPSVESGEKNKALTNRQSQVLDLIAQGKSNKQIAYDMGVSESTVKLHINALLRSLNVSNRTQAVVTAQKMGII